MDVCSRRIASHPLGMSRVRVSHEDELEPRCCSHGGDGLMDHVNDLFSDAAGLNVQPMGVQASGRPSNVPRNAMSSCVRAVGSWGRGPQRRGEHRSDNGPDDDERNDATPSSGQCSSDQVKHRIDRWIVERGSPGRSTSSGPEAYDGGMRCTIALTADAIVVSSISPSVKCRV